MAEAAGGEALPTGPQPGVSYPIKVQYCGECTLPIEVSAVLNFADFLVARVEFNEVGVYE